MSLRMPEKPDAATDHRRAIAERNVASILDAAERLLERGVQATISAVAAEAGLSRVTVYAHFPTREDLLKAVTERAVRLAVGDLETARLDEGSAAEALDRVVTLSWRVLDRRQAMARATAEQLSADDRQRLHGALLAEMRRLVERGRAQGDFRADLPAEWLVASFYALLHATSDEVRAGRLEATDAPEVLRTTLRDLFLRNLPGTQ
jgi:TetR/AcrR family transcriptional repressor of mexCD-oprJ operon